MNGLACCRCGGTLQGRRAGQGDVACGVLLGRRTHVERVHEVVVALDAIALDVEHDVAVVCELDVFEVLVEGRERVVDRCHKLRRDGSDGSG